MIRIVLLALTFVSALACQAAFAQNNGRMTILVGVPAGGPVDTVARMVAEKLRDKIDRAIVVENRPGANTLISLDATHRAPPDGSTLAIATLALSTLKYTSKSFAYDPLNDFSYITQLTAGPLLLVASTQQPFKTLAEFLAYARAHPGMNFATAGVGSALDMDILSLASMANFKVTLIPYQGSAPEEVALAANEVPAALDAYLSAKPNIDGGRVRILAVGTPKRFPLHPDAPAIAEQVPGYEASTNWFGVVGPPGMPADLTARLSTAFADSIKSPDVRKRLNDTGIDAVGSTPAEFRAFVARDMERIAKAAQVSGIKPQ
jgi:tripartite-type tricarboxylate transporter receptor subunit TctC